MRRFQTTLLLMLLGLGAFMGAFGAAEVSAAVSDLVRVDQVGYLPSENPKLGMVVGSGANLPFHVVDVSSGVTAFSGTSGSSFTDTDSADVISTMDFGSVTAPATYRLSLPGIGDSHPFVISTKAYLDAWTLAMRSFYGQRCGTAVNMGIVNGVPYQHAICHASGACNDNPSVYHSSSGLTGTRNTPKGWHDAGDYGKYIVNSGISTGQVLWTYEWFQDRVEDVDLDIPESGNGTPDILDEARWNLEWMLSMQDTDGGVWHKNTSAFHGAFVMPEYDNGGTRYVIGTGSGAPYKTSCATADFAAVMAVAARLYQPFDPTFAASCLAAAQNAWTWLQNYPNVTYTQPTSISTGGYNDGNCSDERLWAAAELFHTTGTSAYSAYVSANAGSSPLFSTTSPQGWGSLKNMALWAYYFSGQPAVDAPLTTRIYNDTLAAAGTIATRTASNINGYKVSLTSGNYYWGSNGVVANYGVLLLAANRMSPQTSYGNAALNNIHYLLGRNTHNVSFVTHVGSNPFLRPHHRPSGSGDYSGGPPWPGLLSGGPTANDNDGSGLNSLPSYPPAKRWVDQTASYASNENAINWNSALVLLLAGCLPGKSCGTQTCTPTATPTQTPTQTPTPSLTFTPTGTWYTDTPTPTVTPLETWGIQPVGIPIPFPNPVREGNSTRIRVEIREGPADVKVSLYTLSSRLVRVMRLPAQNAGYQYVPMECVDEKNKPLSNGLYFVAVEAGGHRAFGKLLIQR